jgi:hypothetical protein
MEGSVPAGIAVSQYGAWRLAVGLLSAVLAVGCESTPPVWTGPTVVPQVPPLQTGSSITPPAPGDVYTLTISVPPDQCPTIPESVLRRTYAARVVRAGSQLTAVLSGARFSIPSYALKGDRFTGQVEDGVARFSLSPYNYWDGTAIPDVAEIVESTGWTVIIYGTAVTTVSDSGMTGVLDGGMDVMSGDIRVFPHWYVAWCATSDISFSLVR